jgi:hypothetical protein
VHAARARMHDAAAGKIKLYAHAARAACMKIFSKDSMRIRRDESCHSADNAFEAFEVLSGRVLLQRDGKVI